MLSLVFSVLVPRQQRFVQHLQKPDHHFSDYFGSRPGFVVIETQRPDTGGDLFGEDPTARFVIGQMVCLRERNQDPERVFFSFQPAPDLTFDHLPLRGLSQAMEIKDLDAARQWLQEAKMRHPTFRTFRSQQDWEAHLEEEGADPWLVDRQVDFCGAEGGIDGFLDFRSEAEFLRRFYGMALQTDAAESARTTLGEALEKQRNRPMTQDRIRVLQDLSETFAPFVGAAKRRDEAEATQVRAEARVAGAHLALGEAKGRLAAQQIEREDRSTRINQELADLKRDHQTASGREEAICATQHQRGVAEAEREQQGAVDRVRQLDHRSACIAAAQALKPLRETEQRVAGFRTALTEAEQDIEPILTRARQAGNRLRARLAWETAEQRRAQARASSEREAGQAQERMLAGEVERLRDTLREVERTRGGLKERFAARERALERLLRDQIAVGETASAALARHEQVAGECDRRLKEVAAQDGQLAEEHKRTEDERAGHLQTMAAAKVELAQDRMTFAKGGQARDSLASDPLLRRLLDAEVVDPDTDGVSDRLAGHVQRTEADRQQKSRRIEDLDRDRLSIAATGLAAADDDAQAALDWLAERHVGGVRHYPAYLADIAPDVATARRLMQSDPARFGGLHVYSPADLDRIRALPRDGLKLRKPIQVSLPVEDDAAARVEPADALILSQPFDAAYDKGAAAAYGRQLDAQRDQLQGEFDMLEEALGLALGLARELENFLATYGAGRLTSLRQSIAEQESRIDGLQHRSTLCDRRIAEIEEQRGMLGEQREAARDDLSRTQACQHALRTFIEEHEDGIDARTSALAEAEQRIDALGRDIVAKDAERKALGERIAGFRSAAEEAGRAAAGFNQRYAVVTEYDASLSAPDEEWTAPTLAELDRAYGSAWQALDDVTRDKGLNDLKTRIEEGERAAIDQRKAYRKALAGLDESEVEPLIREDLDTLAAQTGGELIQARHQESTWAERLKQRTEEDQAFTRKRRFPGAAAPDLDGASETELDDALAETTRRLGVLVQQQQATSAAQTALAEAIGEAKARLKQLGTWIATLDTELVPDRPPETVALPQDDAGIERLHKDTLLGLKQARAAREHEDKAARGIHDSIRSKAEHKDLVELEPQIAVELRSNRFEDACRDAQRHAEAIAERIATCRFELEKLDENLGVVRARLQQLLDDAIGLLNRATQGIQIPAEVPHFGGQAILKMRARFGKLPPEQRGERLKHYIDRLVRENRLPASGSDLAAELLGEAARALSPDGGLGLEFLKPTDLGVRHLPIAMRVGSGGESMTAALFLYLVMAQLRTKSKAVGGKANSGFLILDNPFGKANKVSLIRPQVELARHFGIQLIYATGIQDYNALAEFGHLIRLRRAGVQTATGRTHLTTADAEEVAMVESAEYDIRAGHT